MKSVFGLIVIFLAFSNSSAEKDSWYRVTFESLCETLERNVTPERAAKYGALQAYRIRQDTLASDTIRVSFDFISNCCERYDAQATILRDTLMLSYYKTGSETCRCLCDYRFTYSFIDSTKHWLAINVNRINKNK